MTRKSKVTRDVYNFIKILRDEGKPTKHICRKTGLSVTTVCRALRSKNYKQFKEMGKEIHLSDPNPSWIKRWEKAQAKQKQNKWYNKWPVVRVFIRWFGGGR